MLKLLSCQVEILLILCFIIFYYIYFSNVTKNVQKKCIEFYTVCIFYQAKLWRIIFSRIFIKPLKSLKYRATRKTKNIFIMQYGIKTADSAALSVLFLFYSEKNAISSRWKSLNGTERNLFAYIHTRNRGKYFWFSSRVYLRISHLHTLFA